MTPSFRMTVRDVVILQAIARYRFLTADLVQRVVGGSERGVRNRLRLLAAHAYVVCLKSVVTAPFAFGLATKGARLLADQGSVIDHRLDWRTKNDRSEYFVDHTLAVAEAMLQFHAAAHADAIDLVDDRELLPDMPQRTRVSADPFCLRVTVFHQDKRLTIPVVPDRLFALAYPDVRHHFALEVDLGTMDIWANRLVGKSSIRRKLLAYYHARGQKKFAETWGFKSCRVLIVTTSDSRIESMVKAQQRLAPQCPPGLFLYSTSERIAQRGALGPAWSTSKRDDVSLLHSTTPERPAELAAPISDDATAPFRQRRTAGLKRELREMTRP